MSDNTNTTHNHPHFAAQPIEISQYTYDAHKPSALATRNLVNQDPTQHSATSPCGPTPSRIHPIEHPHDHKLTQHPKHDQHPHQHPKPDQHFEPPQNHPEPQPTPHHPGHRHDEHQAPSSPTSTIGSDSIQPSSPMFGKAERRQSWSKDEMKRGAMEGLLEQGKGKQAKGGYTSTS